MLKNTITNEILVITNVDLNNNSVTAYIAKDEYSKNNENKTIHVLDLYGRIHDNMASETLSVYFNIIDQCENGILVLPEYSDYIKNGVNHWEFPECNYRFYVTNEQITYLILNFKPLVDVLYTEPVNPKITLSEGVLIYIYEMSVEGRQVLDSMNIEIEDKP